MDTVDDLVDKGVCIGEFHDANLRKGTLGTRTTAVMNTDLPSRRECSLDVGAIGIDVVDDVGLFGRAPGGISVDRSDDFTATLLALDPAEYEGRTQGVLLDREVDLQGFTGDICLLYTSPSPRDLSK